MGATSQKSIKAIIESKYSFSHPKSQQPKQISIWKYTEDQLQSCRQTEGESLKWPFKFYNDEGYIFALIENKTITQTQSSPKPSSQPQSPTDVLKQLKTTINLLQILYSFYHGQIEEYLQQKITLESDFKYINQNFNLWIYVYAGQNLNSAARLKLVNISMQFQRYIARGGISSISKLYHEYKDIVDLSREIKLESDDKNEKDEEYYALLTSLVEEKSKGFEGEQNKKVEQEIMNELLSKLRKYNLLNKTIFDLYFKNHTNFTDLFTSKISPYIKVDSSRWQSNQNLIVHNHKTNVQAVAYQPKKLMKKDKQAALLNDSLPFQCEITQINFNDKKKPGGFGNQQSNIMDDLSVLNQKRVSQFIKITCPEQSSLVLTDYTSIKDYNQLQELNVRLVINLSANLCFNYYLNDIDYQHYYLTPLPNKVPADAVLFQNNIEHIIPSLTHAIISHTINNKVNDPQISRVLIHSAGGPFSDQNTAVVIGYLIQRYLYTFQKAFEKVSSLYQEYKGDKGAKLSIHKLYIDQLLTLEGRVLITSDPNYGVSLVPTYWRAYQMSNNHCSQGQDLIARFVGQLTTPNQLTSLPNYNQHFYILLSHQLPATLTPIIQKWQKDQTTKASQGINGIKVLAGKQFTPKEIYLTKSRKIIPLLLKYQLLNRSKCLKSFNNQFLFQFIQSIVAQNLQVEIIQKSFRKSQTFIPLYLGFQEEIPAAPLENAPLPYNPKEKLTFKYPYLRPTWQAIKDDQYYFILQVSKAGASVQIVKGKHWAGLQADREGFFASLVELYLQNIDEEKIWIAQQGQESLFGDEIYI